VTLTPLGGRSSCWAEHPARPMAPSVRGDAHPFGRAKLPLSRTPCPARGPLSSWWRSPLWEGEAPA